MGEKIQTGLRIPEDRYLELKELADRAGMSVNAVALYLIDVGLSAVNLGVRQAAHSAPRILQHNDEQ